MARQGNAPGGIRLRSSREQVATRSRWRKWAGMLGLHADGGVGPLRSIGGNGWVRCGRTMELRASGCAGSCERGEAVSQV